MENKYVTASLQTNKAYLNRKLSVEKSFDIINRDIIVGERNAGMYFIDGFCKDELMQKLLQAFMELSADAMPETVAQMAAKHVSYVEVDLEDEWDKIITNILSGVFALFIEGYDKCLLIDARTYPARSVTEPDKDKTLRGSKDGFVETIVFNTALIRRRIRSADLRMEMLNAGKTSKTDIVLCYMDSRVDKEFLANIRERINSIKADALTMNQESLAECLYKGKWYNPFPKFKFTERPDSASAQILEGSIIILVDNSPTAMITPTSIFDVLEEADDYYFPPITGSYLRMTRFFIAILTFFVTPTFLLLMNHPAWIPQGFAFIMVKESINIPLIWQLLMLELAIDGLRLAAINTPSMLSTPLSIMAALVLGEFSVKSGWFNSEIMLYMAFVAIASYTQASYELGYALKFMRIITLVLTSLFGIYGYVAGVAFLIVAIACNKTISNESYLYPLWPLNIKLLCRRIFRLRMPKSLQKAATLARK